MSTSGSKDHGLVPDEVLVARVRVGDAVAFEKLVARHSDKLHRLVMRFVRNQHDTQEILQEVFLTVWRKLPGFEGRAQFSSWLHRVAVNASLIFLRGHARHRETAVDDSDLARLCTAPGKECPIPGLAGPREPAEQLECMELRGQLQKAVERLPDGLRTVFVVRHVEGLSTARTACSLGLTRSAVKTRLHRARQVLREDMRGYIAY
jgi:RNA polymerase sigma-70 factor (ECF subfamily)